MKITRDFKSCANSNRYLVEELGDGVVVYMKTIPEGME